MESFYSFMKNIDNEMDELIITREEIEVGAANYGRIGGRSSNFSSVVEEAAIKRERITNRIFKLMDLRYLIMNTIIDYAFQVRETVPTQIVRSRIKGLKKQEILKKYKVSSKKYNKYEEDCINYVKEVLEKKEIYF